MAIQIEMCGLSGTPIRGDVRKLAHNQRFDVRLCGLLIVEVRANVSNVRIGQTDDLPGVAGIGENFLISGEAGIENNFAAAARDRTGRAAVEDAPVLQRENCGSMQNLGQCALRFSFFLRFGGSRK